MKLQQFEFNSKKHLKAYVKELLSDRGICDIYPEDKDFKFLTALFQNKPSNINVTPNIFHFRKNDFTDIINKIMVTVGDTQYAFSWNKCIAGKDTENHTLCREACRVAIRDQIRDCKNASTECAYCKKKWSNDEIFEIDHIKEFSYIYKEFWEQYDKPQPTSYHSNSVNMKKFHPDDYEIEKDFQKYHKDNATLQMLCYNCHKKKTKDFYKKLK